MIKIVIKIFAVFAIGIAGGIFSSQIILPRLLEQSIFGLSSEYLAKITSGPVYLTEKKEIVVQENTALQDSIEKVKNSIIAVRTKTKSGKIIYGSGLILTTDGLAVTLSSVLPRGEEFAFFINGKAQNYQILKRDDNKNLVLIKIGQANLEACGFADFNELKIGQRVFLLGSVFEENDILQEANQGIVKFFTEDYIKTNIFEDSGLAGSALFDIEGKLLGLNYIVKDGSINSVPVTIIREFAGF